jgi:hypothetical protein
MPVGDSPFDQGVGDNAPIIPSAKALDPSSILENLEAGYKASRAGPGSTNVRNNAYAKPYYDTIVTNLQKRGYDVSNPLALSFDPIKNQDPLGSAARDTAAIWASVAKERAKDPSFLKDVPDQDALHAKVTADRQRDYADANDVLSRAGWAGKVAGFVGQVAGGWSDPENYVGGIAAPAEAAAGKTIAKTILRDALTEGATNAASAGLALPGMKADAEQLGQPMDAGDMLSQVGQAAVFGAAIGGGKVAVPHIAAPIGKAAQQVFDASIAHLPGPMRDAASAAALRAGTVQDHALLIGAQRALNPSAEVSMASPDEHAAMATVRQDADVREASAFHPTQNPANESRLAAVRESLGMAREAPAVPSPAPMPATAPTDLAARTNRAEGFGKNPSSSASGYGQFINSTWLSLYHQHFGGEGLSDAEILAKRNDPALGQQMTALYGQQNGAYLRAHGQEDSDGNKSLAHFLGAGDALKVLQAAPDTPIERVIASASFHANEKLLHGKSASEVIAWAHKRVGDQAGGSVGRADAVPDFEVADATGALNLPPVVHRTFSPDELTTDAAAMQYKSGGDQSGVTDRLAGVDAWNPLLSGKVVVWERADGANIVADGHQRLGLAQRIAQNDPGQNVKLDGVVLRELDGVSAQQARVIAALKNIEEGSGSAVDAARVLRDAPNGAQILSPNAPGRRIATGLANLSSDAFGSVLNNVIDPRIAAQIGMHAAASPERHMALVKLLKQTGITTPDMAGSVVRQALADGFGSGNESQLGLFGDEAPDALYGAAAKVLAGARRQLKDEKRSFNVLTNDAGRIEQAGNVLDHGANKAKVVGNEEALAILDATAHSSGPVRDALLAAARSDVGGSRTAVRDFLDSLDGIDLRTAAAGVGEGAGDGVDAVAGGRGIDGSQADAELADGRGVSRGATPYEQAIAAGHASLDFSDPVGPRSAEQTAGIEHDLRLDLGPKEDPATDARQTEQAKLGAEAPMRAKTEQDGTMGSPLFDAADQPTFKLDEDAPERTFADILNEADSDLAAIDALKGCL